MSSITSVTVKANDGTTDVVYTAIEGASGNTPAIWQAPALGATGSTRPEVRFSTKKVNGKPSLSKVVGTMMRPYSIVNTTTGITSVERRLIGRIELPFDSDVPASFTDEFVSQFVNFCASAHAKTQFKEGRAAV